MNRNARRRLPRRTAMLPSEEKSRGGQGLPSSIIGKSQMTAPQCKPDEGREKVCDSVEQNDSPNNSFRENAKITNKLRETEPGTNSSTVKNDTSQTTDNSQRRTRRINRRSIGRLLPTKSTFIPVEKKIAEKEAFNVNTPSDAKRESVETVEKEERSNKRSRTDGSEVVATRQKLNSDSVWNGHYAAMTAFKIKNGHCLIPKVHPENQPLSSWVFRQRA